MIYHLLSFLLVQNLVFYISFQPPLLGLIAASTLGFTGIGMPGPISGTGMIGVGPGIGGGPGSVPTAPMNRLSSTGSMQQSPSASNPAKSWSTVRSLCQPYKSLVRQRQANSQMSRQPVWSAGLMLFMKRMMV